MTEIAQLREIAQRAEGFGARRRSPDADDHRLALADHARAVVLGRRTAKRSANCRASALFDAAPCTRHLQTAYEMPIALHRAGQGPGNIDGPPSASDPG
ncbi:MAG: hypothetical protein ACK41Y_12430 [Paracoccus hibiscisoli]